MKQFLTGCACFTLLSPVAAGQAIRTGKHMLSLQWIRNRMGSATVRETNERGIYAVTGQEYSKDRKSYLLIDGTLKPLSGRELIFDGTITTRTPDNNDGKPCIKKGQYRFYASGMRKYWRLQEMENCAGNNLVDYVDLFF